MNEETPRTCDDTVQAKQILSEPKCFLLLRENVWRQETCKIEPKNDLDV